MIEPAALAKPVLVGPFTANFADAVFKLREAEAIHEVVDGESLGEAIKVMLSTPSEAALMARRAQDVVRREQGATARHTAAILRFLPEPRGVILDPLSRAVLE
jgi:3-deoxy-D-manno-octulosonic-acid transferase